MIGLEETSKFNVFFNFQMLHKGSYSKYAYCHYCWATHYQVSMSSIVFSIYLINFMRLIENITL